MRLGLHKWYVRINLFLLAALAASLAAAPSTKKNVAVMNFTNASAARSLDYLKMALPESISGALASSKEIRVIERVQLGKVLSEIELEQSGALDANGINRAGKLARADVLMLGSFSGNAERMNVTLKAVDVTTAVIIESRSLSAPLSQILEEASQASLAMASAIAGGKSGFFTLTTTPQDAELLVDGIVVGKTPIVEYKLSAGSHSIFIRKQGFRETEKRIEIHPGETARLTEGLTPVRDSTQIFVGAGYMRMLPQNSTTSQGNFFFGQLGISLGKFSGDFSFGLNNSWDHSYVFASTFGSLPQTRQYSLMAFALGFTFEPFNDWEYISPYAGVILGYARATDYLIKGSDSQRLAAFDLFQYGAKAGFEFFPKFRVSLFIEGRYLTYGQKVQRSTQTNQGIVGEATVATAELDLSHFAIGGGARLNF